MNCYSVGLSYDGDSRASYVLIDEREAAIRRVPYDVEREIRILTESRYPHVSWIVRMLQSASPQLP